MNKIKKVQNIKNNSLISPCLFSQPHNLLMVYDYLSFIILYGQKKVINAIKIQNFWDWQKFKCIQRKTCLFSLYMNFFCPLLLSIFYRFCAIIQVLHTGNNIGTVDKDKPKTQCLCSLTSRYCIFYYYIYNMIIITDSLFSSCVHSPGECTFCEFFFFIRYCLCSPSIKIVCLWSEAQCVYLSEVHLKECELCE